MKRPRKSGLCVLCNKRPALFKYKGEVKRDRDHNVCLQCFRSIRDHNQAVAQESDGKVEHSNLG